MRRRYPRNKIQDAKPKPQVLLHNVHTMALGDSDISLLKSKKFLPRKASWSKLSNNRHAKCGNHISFSGTLGLNITGQSVGAIKRKISTARERASGSTRVEVVDSNIIAAIIDS
jgi:hypothetical protein